MIERWGTKKLGEVCEFIGDGDWIESKDQSSNGIRLIQTGNIGQGYFIEKENNRHYISEETFERLHCTEIYGGDILISRLPDPVGRACIIPSCKTRMITAVDCSILRLNKTVCDAKFLIHYASSSAWFSAVERRCTGSTRKRISRKNLQDIPLPIPPIAQQKRIVAKIDEAFEKIDKIKANAERNLANAKELFQSALNEAMQPKPGWAEKRLGDIGETLTGMTPSTKDKSNFGDYMPFVKPGDILPFETIKYRLEGLSAKGIAQSRLVKKGSVLMVCIGASIGKTGYADCDCTCNQQINALMPKGFNGRYLYYLLSSEEFKKKLIDESGQMTLPIISKSKWESLSVRVSLSLQEQNKIAAYLDEVSAQTKDIQMKYDSTIFDCRMLRQSILKDAFAGRL